MDERLAVHGAALPLEQLAWGMQPPLRLELVEETGQPPGWSRVLLGWLPLLEVQEARSVESPVA